jgi:flavin-dependent dehydrogenase
VAALGELGVDHVLDGFAPVSRLKATGPARCSLCAELGRPAYVVPRRVLDGRLVNAAVSPGAELIRGRIADVVLAGDRVVVDGHWSARCVVGADGANSIVRRRLGLARTRDAHLGVALRGYETVPGGSGLLDISCAPGRLWPAYGWLQPTRA